MQQPIITAAIVVLVFPNAMAPALAQDDLAVRALAYVPGAGLLLKGNASGLSVSRDEGANWEPASPSVAAITAIDVAAGEGGPVYAAGPEAGLVRSADGVTWAPVATDLPDGELVALAAHATQPETLYAVLADEGIFRSRDGGASFTLMDRGPDGIAALIHTDLPGSMESGWLYAAAAEGLRFSMDCFCLWREGEGAGAPAQAVVVRPGDPQLLFTATAGGLAGSIDGGKTWSALPGAPPDVTALTFVRGALIAGTASGELFRSTDSGASWEPL